MEEKEKKAQEMYMQFQMIDQQIKQLERQLEIVTHQLMELSTTSSSLDDFEKVSVGKEVLVPLSAGIFAKASLKETSKLLVNVGANVVVTKDVPSTKKLIQRQIDEIRNIHNQLMSEMDKLTGHAAQLEMQLQEIMK